MKNSLYVTALAITFGLLACGNSSKTVNNEAVDQDTIVAYVCCTDDLEDS